MEGAGAAGKRRCGTTDLRVEMIHTQVGNVNGGSILGMPSHRAE
jgi:hypothetical protein